MQSKEDTEDTTTTVKTIGNEMFFYGDITQESILDFTESFKKLEIDVLKKAADMWGRIEQPGLGVAIDEYGSHQGDQRPQDRPTGDIRLGNEDAVQHGCQYQDVHVPEVVGNQEERGGRDRSANLGAT